MYPRVFALFIIQYQMVQNNIPIADQPKQTVKIDNQSFFVSVEAFVSTGNRVRIRVRGNSMFPFLYEGDEVLLEQVGAKVIKSGDIVLAQWGNGYVLHRVVRLVRGTIWLAGDNNLAQVEKVTNNQLIAVLVAAFRGHQALDVHATKSRRLGIVWYYLRPLRRVWTKTNSLLFR
jgi:signal peptidase I